MRAAILKQARLLVVAEESFVVKALGEIFTSEGYQQVEAARDPREAFARQQEYRSDLIILDWGITRLSAAELVLQLRATFSADLLLPVLVVTAAADAAGRAEAVRCGATDFLSNPFDPAAISTRVANLLELRFLQRERQYLSFVLDHVRDGIVACDALGVSVLLNRAMYELHGLPAAATPPENWAPQYVSNTTGKPLELKEGLPLARALSGEIVRDLEMTLLPHDGSKLRLVKLAGQPILSPSGEKVGAMVTVQDGTALRVADMALRQAREELERHAQERAAEIAAVDAKLRREIAERERFERALTESEARKAAILEAALDAIVTMDGKGMIVELNSAAEKLFGIASSAARGREMAELIIPPQYREMHRRGLAQYLATGESAIIGRRIEINAQRIDGTQVSVELEVIRVVSAAEPMFTGYLRDLTGRKQAEAALRDSDEKFRAIFDSTPAVVFIKDLQSRFLMVNPGFTTLLGVAQEDVIGRTNIDQLSPDEAAVLEQNDQAVFASGQAMEFEEKVMLADGPRIFLSVKVPLRDSAGKVYALCGIATDITERKHAEAAILAAKAEAERANAAKSEFLSRMSHELRTPLNAILGFAQLFEMEGRDPEERENVEQILKGGRHLLHLINEVLDISRIEADRIALSIEAVPVGISLCATLALLRPLAETRGVQLMELECAHEVFADRQRLEQVFINLVSNAIKYNRAGGRVAFAFHETEERAFRLEVQDTGRGIAPEQVEKVFQPFERLGQVDESIEGIGLGLTISKRLIKLMGGRIGVESAVGVGSTFWIELPLARGEPSPAASTTRTEVAPEPDDRKVLLYIEDNLTNLLLIERIMFHRPQVKMITAQNAHTGLDVARTHRVDLILLDLRLPDMPGDEVLEALRAHPRTAGIPVVVISADAIGGEIDRLLELGACAYLSKPFEVDRLLRVLDDSFRESDTPPSAAWSAPSGSI